ncbi:MAG TPA: hypothetical protein VII41_10850 [Steroidobacteraceae bacterium]|jgi:hypothetical protein
MADLCARLEAAAMSLTGPGHIKDRLFNAYCRHLEDIQQCDVPGELAHEFGDMIQALHRAAALPGDDVVKASVRKLSNEQACRYAELVIKLYGMFAGMSHVAARNARPVVPLAKFLATEASSNS